MLPGFEKITADLKPAEEVFVNNFIVPALKKKIGEENAITNKSMREGLFTKMGMKISDPKMRKYVNYIRKFNLVPPCLCSSSKGYFVPKNKEELEKWLSSYQKRINEMSYVLEAIEYWNNGGGKL